jgi:hypothetical protein
MNRVLNASLLLAAAVAASCLAPDARGQNITNITYSGAGGIGSGPFSGNTAEPQLTYSSVAPIDLTITVDTATTGFGSTYYISETPAFGYVHNTTGVPWTGFTWQFISGPSAAFDYNTGSPDFSGLDFTNPVVFPTVTGTATLATFSGGTLASGAFFEPAFRFSASAPGTYVLEETPLVPEPTTFAMFGSGLIGLGVFRLRRQR